MQCLGHCYDAPITSLDFVYLSLSSKQPWQAWRGAATLQIPTGLIPAGKEALIPAVREVHYRHRTDSIEIAYVQEIPCIVSVSMNPS